MFKQAVNATNNSHSATKGFTANGAVTYTTTFNKVLDLFAIIGSLRNKSLREYLTTFEEAYGEDRRLTLQMLLWLRDARQGAGERKTTYDILNHLEVNHPQDMELIIPVLAQYGRWDDLLQFKTSRANELAVRTFAAALKAGDGLAAKWAPREYKFKRTATKVGDKVVRTTNIDKSSVANQSRARNNKFAAGIANELGISKPNYRKLVSSMSNTVEQNMCAKTWTDIDYNKLPTHASKQYVEAFKRNDPDRYQQYLDALATGEAKVNATTIMPHEVVRMIRTEDTAKEQLALAMWDAMPRIMGENNILPMVDTSGSMSSAVGGSENLTCMDVAIALGLYVSTKQTGAFQNMWLNFSEKPTLRTLTAGNLKTHVNDLYHKYNHDWGYSTNIQAAFDQVLAVAIRNKVSPEHMPQTLLIMSDMEFNSTGYSTNYEAMVRKFRSAGYELPNVVFWNLKARPGNNPVRAGTKDTALVSGFNPNVLKAVLTGEKYDPVKIMLDTIDTEHYRVFGL